MESLLENKPLSCAWGLLGRF